MTVFVGRHLNVLCRNQTFELKRSAQRSQRGSWSVLAGLAIHGRGDLCGLASPSAKATEDKSEAALPRSQIFVAVP
jgi:hypothetical protein